MIKKNEHIFIILYKSSILFLKLSNIICSCNKSYNVGNDISNFNFLSIRNSSYFNLLFYIYISIAIYSNILSFSYSNLNANINDTIPYYNMLFSFISSSILFYSYYLLLFFNILSNIHIAFNNVLNFGFCYYYYSHIFTCIFINISITYTLICEFIFVFINVLLISL